MAKAKTQTAESTETIDDTNKAVIDSTPPVAPAPMPLDMRIAAMLGMGLDIVRERMVGKEETVLLQLVEDRNHPDLATMLQPSTKK